jgi:hypothetical protein
LEKEGNMMIDDRFTAGFIAGIIGGAVASILDYISYGLGITKLLYIDWASVFILGHRFENIGEALLGQWGNLLFCGMAGVIFAYLVVGVTSKYLYFKAIAFAYMVCFFTNAMVFMFDMNALKPIGACTALSDIITDGIYGLVLAYAYLKFYFPAAGSSRNQA